MLTKTLYFGLYRFFLNRENHNFQNYRPISLLSVFSKIFEKTLYSRIYYYLVKHNLIFDKQFGFRSSYSTNSALLSITEGIREHIDSGSYVCGIFVDLELRGNVNRLIQSYLANRKQYVSINGFESDLRYFVWSSSGLLIRTVVILNTH